MGGMNLALDMSLGSRPSGGGAVVPGANLVDLSTWTAPAVRYSARSSSKTTSGSGLATRVATLTDLQGTANATAGSELNWGGPKYRTEDGSYARPFMRFDTNEYLTVGAGLTLAIAQQQAITVLIVGRFHRLSANAANAPIFNLGSHEAGTDFATGGGPLWEHISASTSTPYPRCVGVSALASGNIAKVLPGTQMQVSVICCRAGSTSFLTDGVVATQATGVFGSPTAGGKSGAEIGRYSNSPGTAGTGTPQVDGPGAGMDVYEIVIWKNTFTDAELQAISAAYMAEWAITAKTDQAVIAGDSIGQGAKVSGDASPVYSGDCTAMRLTDPGQPWAMPSTYRVSNAAVNGYTAALLTTQRDATNSIKNFKLTGKNQFYFQVGVNDFGAGGPSRLANAVYDGTGDAGANIVNIIAQASVGLFAKGWTAIVGINVANSSGTLQTQVAALRPYLRDTATFKTAVGDPGSGRLYTVDLAAITVGGTLRFNSAANTADLNYYQIDGTHPNVNGTLTMVTGGDVAANGISYALQNAT